MRPKNPNQIQNIIDLLLNLLFISLPVNIGLHFILPSAYVGGLLIDYLVPTIYVQDIIVLVILFLWIYKELQIAQSNYTFIVGLLLFTLALSCLLALRPIPSFYALFRWVLYGLVSIFIYLHFDFKKHFSTFAKILCIWLIFLGLLALAQYYKQGALFNNYLFLGEQPYSLSTPLIDKENIFGSAKIPAYGVFRHPNIFGGFLSVLLILVLYSFRTKYIEKKLFYFAYTFGIVGLFLTFSYFSWASFIFGFFLLIAENRVILKKLLIFFVYLLIFLSFFIHKISFPSKLMENPSVYKRIELLEAGYKMTAGFNYLFGAGLNNETVYLEQYILPTKYIRFVQPTHNIFVLLASEAGLIFLAIFVYFLYISLRFSYYYKYFLFVILTQIVFMSCFDHYFITIHQTFLLLWILLGLVFV